jgi:hypothetical protein
MAEGLPPVFVSHAGPDTNWADWVAWHLREAGHQVELDAWHWQVGESFITRMRQAMEIPGIVFVALWSEAYFEQGRYTAMEWDAILAASRETRRRVVPLRVTPVRPPDLEGSLLYADLFDIDPATALARLLSAVQDKKTPTTPPEFPGRAGSRARPGPRPPGILPSVWNVRRRNPSFVGRDDLLAALRDALANQDPTATQTLHGIGGSGKSSLAVEYAHRFAGDYDAVWWVDAEDPTTVRSQLGELAVAAGLVEPRADVEPKVSAAQAWLRRTSRWLVLFDAAENPPTLIPLLPDGTGHVLITSRDRRLEQAGGRIGEVGVFTREESVSLLRTRLPALSEADADAVAEGLGDLPLAVAQAASFMAESAMPAAEYLRELGRHGGDLLAVGTPVDYPGTAAAATRMALERIGAEKDDDLPVVGMAAVRLAGVVACLAPEPVPVPWFVAAAQAEALPEPLAQVATSTLMLRRSLALLSRYGVTRMTEGGAPVLHRVTAAVIRRGLGDAAEDDWEAAGAVVVAGHPGAPDDTATWPAWAALVPHVLALDPANSGDARLRQVALDVVRLLLLQGDVREARRYARDFHAAWSGTVGESDPQTLTALLYLAQAYRSADDFRRSSELTEHLLARLREALGEDHPQTIGVMISLAVDHRQLGSFDVARTLDEAVLSRSRKLFGENHPHTLGAASNLAIDLHELGEFEAARQVNEDVLTRRREYLGENHPATLVSASNLAANLRGLGQVAQAAEIDADVLERRRQVLGSDHPDTLVSIRNITLDRRLLGGSATGEGDHAPAE